MAHHGHRWFTIWTWKKGDSNWFRYYSFCGVCYSGDDKDMVIAAGEKVLDGSDADMMVIAPSDWGVPGIPKFKE